MVDLGGFKGVLTETKALGIMVNTCGSLYGVSGKTCTCVANSARLTRLPILSFRRLMRASPKRFERWPTGWSSKSPTSGAGSNFLFRYEKASGRWVQRTTNSQYGRARRRIRAR